MSGPAVKSHTRPNKGRRFSARRKISYLLLSLDCRQILVPVSLLHRYHRTHQVHVQVLQQSEVTIGHQETGAIHPKTKKNNERDNNRASGDRLRDLPQWLEEFTENLDDTEVPAPAHISHDSDSERPTKVVSKLRKHSVYTHFPKDPNCEVCLRTKMTGAPCRRRFGEAVPRAEKFGDLITADHILLNEEYVNLETTTDTQSGYKILPLNGYNLILAKQKLLRRRKKVKESFSSRRKCRKSFTLTSHWNLANLVKICHGIIELLHLIDPSRMVLLKERYAEKKEHLLYCCNRAWMKMVG